MRRPPFRNVRLNGLKPCNEARLWATSISSIHLLQLNVPVVFDPLDMFDVFLVEFRDVVQRHPYACDEERGHKPLPSRSGVMEEVSLPSRSNLIMPALTHVKNTKLPRTRQLISSKF